MLHIDRMARFGSKAAEQAFEGGPPGQFRVLLQRRGAKLVQVGGEQCRHCVRLTILTRVCRLK